MRDGVAPYAVFGVTTADSLMVAGPVLRELARRGWRTKAVCDPSTLGDMLRRSSDLDITLISAARSISPGRDARTLAQWLRLLRRERPDMVIGATPKAAMISMHAALLARVPTRVFHVWGARWDGDQDARQAALLRALDRMTATCATDVIAVSQSLADLLVRNRVCGRPMVVSRGGAAGVDLDEYRPAERSGPPTLGFVGRLTSDKGVQDVLSVFAACRAVHPTCRLVLVGPEDGAIPLSAAVRSQLAAPGIEWLGAVLDVAPVVRTFDVLVFPSVREGFPSVVSEAAACGVPTVGYAVTGVVDAVVPGITGLRVPPGDVSALSAATLSLLGTPEGRALGASARRYAEQHLGREQVVSQLVDVLGEIHSRRSGRDVDPSQRRKAR